MILYFETTSDQSKIIVYSDLIEELNRKVWQSDRNQTEELLTVLDSLIDGQRDKINDILVNPNSGSFTSVRIVLTIVNNLGMALNIQPRIITSSANIKSEGRTDFSEPLLPMYLNQPFITKQKDRL